VDEKGQRVGVVLSPEEYEELIEAAEQLDDIRHLEKAKSVRGKTIPLEEFEARLKAEGRLR
jgi:PHD/YefM family antitoxin component YafN of YafNO toxin-antitoxin module